MSYVSSCGGAWELLLFSLCPGDGLQAFELLFIGSREFIAEQLAEIGFGIFDHIMKFIAI